MYYDGTKLLSLKDIKGKTPEIFICTSNRAAGKTVFFSKYYTNRFLKNNEKFALLYRFNYELDDCADKFFKDIGTLFFQSFTMESKRKASGIYHELYLNGISCGYAISINSADQIKKYAHMFSDVKRILFDEFQSESGHYCNNEIQKFMSVHASIARGGGDQSRYTPVHMLSNPVSILNPYYTALGISDRLTKQTKFLRGNGWVMESNFNESASNAQKESQFNRAFSSNIYASYMIESTYLNDNENFISNICGKSKYLVTLKYEGTEYGIREFTDQNIIYCDDRADDSFPYKITVTTDDHSINFVMLKRNDAFLNSLRWFFEKGCFRFKNQKCKEAILRALSY